jgi:hypothetical protein
VEKFRRPTKRFPKQEMQQSPNTHATLRMNLKKGEKSGSTEKRGQKGSCHLK